MLRTDQPSEAKRCFGCGATLGTATVLGRSWRLLRSGQRIGSRAEVVTLACACGRRIRLLRAVNLAPYLVGAS